MPLPSEMDLHDQLGPDSCPVCNETSSESVKVELGQFFCLGCSRNCPVVIYTCSTCQSMLYSNLTEDEDHDWDECDSDLLHRDFAACGDDAAKKDHKSTTDSKRSEEAPTSPQQAEIFAAAQDEHSVGDEDSLRSDEAKHELQMHVELMNDQTVSGIMDEDGMSSRPLSMEGMAILVETLCASGAFPSIPLVQSRKLLGSGTPSPRIGWSFDVADVSTTP